MPVPRWPSTFPQRFRLSGYGEELPRSVIRSDMGAGPAKVRRRSTATPWVASGDIVMSAAQYADLRDFVENDLGGGALPFEFPDQHTPATWWLVRLMIDDFKASRIGPHWQVQIKIEVLP